MVSLPHHPHVLMIAVVQWKWTTLNSGSNDRDGRRDLKVDYRQLYKLYRESRPFDPVAAKLKRRAERIRMRNIRITYAVIIMAAALALLAVPTRTSAATTDFSYLGNPGTTYKALNKLLAGDEEKTINLTSDIKINGILRPGSNTTINAGNHKIEMRKSGKGILANIPQNVNYGSISNLTINGGRWYVKGNASKEQTLIRITHATGVHLNGMTITDGYEDHAVELIACRDVTINRCNFSATGKCRSGCVEEQLQIDLADRYTAPGVLRETRKAMVNGAPSYNIHVDSCTVNGARGICANFASKNPKNRKAKNYHSRIYINNCRVTGKSSEALALFNTKSATVTNCDITTNAKPSRGTYSNGLHITYIKGTGPKANAKNEIIIRNNTVRGGKNGICIASQNKSQMGAVTISDNQVYCKNGIDAAIAAGEGVAQILNIGNNATYIWR